MMLGLIDARHRLVEHMRIVTVSSRNRLASMAMIALVPLACVKSEGWLMDRSMAVPNPTSAAAMSDQSISSPPVTTDTSDQHDASVVLSAVATDEPAAPVDRSGSVQFGPSGPMLNELLDTVRLFLPHIPIDNSTAVKPALSGSLTSVAVQDHIAYLQFGGAALSVVDVSEPSQPSEIGRLSLAACPGYEGRAVATADHIVVLCATGDFPERPDRVESDLIAFRPGGPPGLELVGTHMVHDVALDAALSGSWAHLTTAGMGPSGYRLRLYGIDLSRLPSEEPASDLDIGLVGLHLVMDGQKGAVFGYNLDSQALQFLDLARPAVPRLAGRLELPAPEPQKPWLRLSSLAMGESVVYGFQSLGLIVVDARDIDHPVTVAAEDHDFGDCDGFLNVGSERLVVLTRNCRDGEEALYVLDLWKPTDQEEGSVGPKLLGKLPLSTQGWRGEHDHPIAVEGQHVLIADDGGTGFNRRRSLVVVDISEPAAPRLVGRLAFP
jgi:hypothetical protein